MLNNSILTSSTAPPLAPPPLPFRGGLLAEEDAIFDKPRSPPSPTSARVLGGVQKTSSRNSNSSSNQSRNSNSSKSSGGNNGNGRPDSQQREYRPFPVARNQYRFPSPKATASQVEATHRVNRISPMPSRGNTVPTHVQLALEYLKEDLEQTQHELRLHQQKQNADYGPDRKTEIFIDSLLQEELIKPVRRARVQQEQNQQYLLSRATGAARPSSSSWDRNNSGLLKTSYPLTRKDAKKRKEARFRTSNNGRSVPVLPSGRAPRRYHQIPSHRRSRSPHIAYLRQTYEPGYRSSHFDDASYTDNDTDDGSLILSSPLQHLRRLKRERDTRYPPAKSSDRLSASESVSGATTRPSDKPAPGELLVANFVDALSCNAVENVLRCDPFDNDANDDDPSIITLEDTATVETVEYESDTAVVLKSSSPNTTSRSRVTSVRDPATSRSSRQPAVAELLKLRKELNQFQRMSSQQAQPDQEQRQHRPGASENHRRRGRDDDEDSLITKEQFRITVTSRGNTRKPKSKKSVRFATPCVTLVKHRPFTDPDEIEKLYFVSEELDEYEYDRETTDGEQYEVRLVEKKNQGLSRVPEEKCADTSVEDYPEDEKLGQNLQDQSFAVSVSYQNRPRLPFDPADELMLSPSDLSALHQDSNSVT